jgi:ribosomal protein L11 methyltransferase
LSAAGSGSSTYIIRGPIPKTVRCEGDVLEREDFLERLWSWFGSEEGGLLGIHEGTLLSEEAVELGLETDSWTVDSGEAPRERDWMAHQAQSDIELYFASEALALAAQEKIFAATTIAFSGPTEQKNQDWDAEWKASWKGISLGDDWSITPPWEVAQAGAGKTPDHLAIRLNPGAGFGTGTHETTQLCLQLLADVARNLNSSRPVERRLEGVRVLDFGSGSGILAIAAARMGAKVDAVEIDPLAIDNARENASLNGVVDQIHYHQTLETVAPQARYTIVLANILRPVLVEFCSRLVGRMAPQSALILSGLIEPDVSVIDTVFSKELSLPVGEVRALNEWRAMRWARV